MNAKISLANKNALTPNGVSKISLEIVCCYNPYQITLESEHPFLEDGHLICK
jgi:hypothetical protein